MHVSTNIRQSKNAMKNHGIEKAFSYTFSSQRNNTKILRNGDTQSRSDDFPIRSFTGKERDEETGYGYFGARYMDHDLMTLWISVDPMADKYPSISPYAYCAWNPVKLVDPKGREVYINGSQADRAAECLQTKKMEVTRDSKTGKLNIVIRNGYSLDDLSNEELTIYNAINCNNISIQITAESCLEGKDLETGNIVNAYKSRDGELYGTMGGSFDGTEFITNNNQEMAITYCFIDINTLERKGINQGVPHEVSEQFLLGEMTIEMKKSIPRADKNQTNPEYMKCHNNAIPETSLGLHWGNFHFPKSKFGYK